MGEGKKYQPEQVVIVLGGNERVCGMPPALSMPPAGNIGA
jgi:hypothetical protein